jgi:hypothetical protein
MQETVPMAATLRRKALGILVRESRVSGAAFAERDGIESQATC